MKKSHKNFNEHFKSDTPQLAFELEDVLEATFLFDQMEKMTIDEEEIAEHRHAISHSIDSLLVAADVAPELKFLIDFLLEYQRIELADEQEWKVEVDLNKLKYCKTLICYLEDMDEVLAVLDFLQDQLVDEQGHDKDRVFFSPESGYCVVRPDILKSKLYIPLSDNGDRTVYYGEKHPLQYQWLEDIHEQFQVLYQGTWLEAESIDFKFPFEHLREI